MCSYIVETARLSGSAKGAAGWTQVDSAQVYYDHPFHAPLDHAVGIDIVDRSGGRADRVVALELSAESAMALVEAILAALKSGEAAHGHDHRHHQHAPA